MAHLARKSNGEESGCATRSEVLRFFNSGLCWVGKRLLRETHNLQIVGSNPAPAPIFGSMCSQTGCMVTQKTTLASFESLASSSDSERVGAALPALGSMPGRGHQVSDGWPSGLWRLVANRMVHAAQVRILHRPPIFRCRPGESYRVLQRRLRPPLPAEGCAVPPWFKSPALLWPASGSQIFRALRIATRKHHEETLRTHPLRHDRDPRIATLCGPGPGGRGSALEDIPRVGVWAPR